MKLQKSRLLLPFELLFSIALISLVLTGSAISQTIRVTINSESGSKIGNLRSISSRGVFYGDYYVSAEQFARVLCIKSETETVLNKLSIYPEGTRVTFSPNNPFVMIGETLYQAPLEVKLYRDELYFPLREFMSLFDRYLPGDYKFDRIDRRLEISFGGTININGLTVEEKMNGTLIKISTAKYFGNNLRSWGNNNNLYVQFYTGKLDNVQMTNTETRGLLLRNTAVQHPQIAQITFKLSAYVEGIDVSENENTGEVLISLSNRNAGNRSLQTRNDNRQLIDINELVNRDRKSWEINTIVIDPGHGGKDPGTNTPDGLKEKDIVLDIALNLGKLLRNSNLVESVILTRESDIFILLQERSQMANQAGGKLFVSIHVNSNNNSRLRGFETYFLSPGKNQDALEIMEIVERENGVMNLYENKDPDRVLTDDDKMIRSLTQSAFAMES